MIHRHGTFSGLAFAVLLVTGAWVLLQGEPSLVVVEVGVEHEKPVSLTLKFALQARSPLLDISQSGSETILLSLPSSWERIEVRNVPLSSVTSDEPEFGFVRWHFPPGAEATFRTTAWDIIRLHNPSRSPLHARVTRIDLEKETTDRESEILSDEELLIPRDKEAENQI